MARSPGRLGCAIESRERDEELLATASRVRRWLVVEQPGPWGDDAIRESRLDLGVAETLRSRARRAGVRVVLVRRPGWVEAATRRVYAAHSDRTHRWIEQLDIEHPQELLRIDLGLVGHDEAPGIGTPAPGIHLVCTHGRHDPCCADFGRPVIRALHAAGAPEIWESSHIGGDRFAANIVCLPTGVYYGRVPPEDAVRILREHDEGLIDLAHYRGRSCYPPLLQAAETFARRELGERRLDAVRLRSSGPLADDEIAVVVERDTDAFEVRVARERAPASRLTCEEGEARPWHYRLAAIHPLPDPPSATKSSH